MGWTLASDIGDETAKNNNAISLRDTYTSQLHTQASYIQETV